MSIVENTCTRHKMVLPSVDFMSDIFKAWFEVHFPTFLVPHTGPGYSRCVATHYLLDGPRFRTAIRAVHFLFSVSVQTDPGAHPAFSTMGTGSLSRGLGGRGVALTIHSHLAPRLCMSESMSFCALRELYR
jgi:hypothetical protein